MSSGALYFYGGGTVAVLGMIANGYALTQDTIDPVTRKPVPATNANIALGYFLILIGLACIALAIYSFTRK
jgi:hypothetical protein